MDRLPHVCPPTDQVAFQTLALDAKLSGTRGRERQ
jgi:hypothetical protein